MDYAHSELGTARQQRLAGLERRFGTAWNIRHDRKGWHFRRKDGAGVMPELHAPDSAQAAVLMSGQDALRRHVPRAVASADGRGRLLHAAAEKPAP